jgi:hypothetical protein
LWITSNKKDKEIKTKKSIIMNKAIQLLCIRDLSIKKVAIKQKVNELRKQKIKIAKEIDDLVNQMVLED